MTNANLVLNAVAVTDEGYGCLSTPVNSADPYTHVAMLTTMVLDYNNGTYVFTGWNSDTNRAYFKASANVARVR